MIYVDYGAQSPFPHPSLGVAKCRVVSRQPPPPFPPHVGEAGGRPCAVAGATCSFRREARVRESSR